MIRKLFSTIIVVLMIASLTVGCSNNDKTNLIDASNSEKEIEEIIMCENYDINTGFAPVFALNSGWGCFYYLGNFYETLVNYEDGKITPGLAESWEVNGKEITFKLREGVKFTDGSDFNAEVVKKNIEMIPKTMGEAYSSGFTTLRLLKDVEVVDKYTVKIIFIEPYYGALQYFSIVRPMGMMSLNAFTEDGLSDEVYSKTFGTGKYMIENAIQGEDYTFVRNENYWGEKPKVKQFVVKTILDMESRIMALRNDEVDFIFGAQNITYDSFSEFINDEKFLAKASESSVKCRNIVLNTTKAPFDDINVRLAVQYAVDKQSICNSLFYGIEEKGDYLFNKELPYCDVPLKPYDYNVEKAKKMLDKAGWVEVEGSDIREKDGQKLEAEMLYQTGIGVEKDLVLVIAAQLKEIGFKINLIGMDMMGCMGNSMSGNFTMFSTSSYGIPHDPQAEVDAMNNATWHYPAQQGLSEKQKLDLKINELSSMTEQDKIQEAYNYILTTLHDEAVYLPVSYRKELVIFNKKKIRDYKFNGQPLNLDVSGIVTN